jgi:glycosyltransferase involved in cell wall biosynthesis
MEDLPRGLLRGALQSPMTPGSISVVIPTFNRAQYLAESIESVLGQTLAPSQVIVINDGSTDGTRSVAEKFRGRIEYLEVENRGKATALNKVMPSVTGEYFWIMDDDDVALPDALSRHVGLLESAAGLGWTYSSYIKSTSRPDGRIDPGSEMPLPQFAADEFLVRLMEECFLVHPTILVRTSCYRVLGPFRADLVRSQDYEMAIRLARNFRCARVAGPTIYRRYHPGARGTAAASIDARQVEAKWLEYMKPTFKNLRAELPLADYLPKSAASDAQGNLDSRRAYLERMVIMGKKMLYDEMLEDLKSSVAASAEQRPLSTPEREMLHRLASYTSGDPLIAGPNLIARIRSGSPGKIGLAIRVELARGLIWRAESARHAGELREALQLARAAVRLCGLRGIASAMLRKNAGAALAANAVSPASDGG